MNIKKILKQIITPVTNSFIANLAILFLVFFYPLSAVLAEEVTISGNGSGSSSEVNVAQNTQTNVEQNNQAQVSNELDSDLNTGDNSASSNTGGETGITTGDVTAQTSIENDLNSSVVNIECCPQDSSYTISGNGADSENNITTNNDSSTSVTVTQNATVTNNILGSANTGDNSADDNSGGNVSIDTGDINAKVEVSNKTNMALVTAPSGQGGDIKVKISSNGSGSVNNIVLTFNNNTEVVIENNSTLANILNWYANTGGNSANGNTGGNVKIKTGNILLDIILENSANVSIVDIECCKEKPSSSPSPTPTPEPTSTPEPSDGNGEDDDDGNGNGDGDDGEGAGAGEVLGAAIGQILPETGNNTLYLATLLCLMALGAGVYLRKMSYSPVRR